MAPLYGAARDDLSSRLLGADDADAHQGHKGLGRGVEGVDGGPQGPGIGMIRAEFGAEVVEFVAC